jgi:hypothetical protein
MAFADTGRNDLDLASPGVSLGLCRSSESNGWPRFALEQLQHKGGAQGGSSELCCCYFSRDVGPLVEP